MTAHEGRWEVVWIWALPLIAGTFVVAALTVADLSWLVAAAAIAVVVCVVVCTTALATADRTSRRAFAELGRRIASRDQR